MTVSVACVALYWPTPGFKGRTFKLCVLTRWDLNFCVRSSPLEIFPSSFRFDHHVVLCLLVECTMIFFGLIPAFLWLQFVSFDGSAYFLSSVHVRHNYIWRFFFSRTPPVLSSVTVLLSARKAWRPVFALFFFPLRNIHWPFATIWQTDQLSQSAPACEHASLNSKQNMCRFFFFSLPKTAVTRLGAEQIEASMSPKSCGVVYFASLSGRSYLSPGERSVNCDALIGCSRWGHRPSGTLYCSEFHKERSRLSVFTRQPGTRPATECPGYMAPADLLTRLIRDRAIPCPSMRMGRSGTHQK